MNRKMKNKTKELSTWLRENMDTGMKRAGETLDDSWLDMEEECGNPMYHVKIVIEDENNEKDPGDEEAIRPYRMYAAAVLKMWKKEE